MIWIGIFKTEKRKIGIFVIIFILSISSSFYCYSIQPHFPWQCFISSWILLLPKVLIDSFLILLGKHKSFFIMEITDVRIESFLYFWLTMLFVYIYWDILSCLIIWLYDKVKKE